MSDSFVYCWHDDQRDMRYIGVHKGSQDDGYICSSKLMLQEYKASIIDSIEYETMKMAAEELQTSVHFIRKMLKEGVARRSDI